MKLVVNELRNLPLYQTVTATQNTYVEAVRINLYKHNFPTGNLIVKIHVSSGELISTSSSVVTAGEISSSAFFHGFVRFYINASLMEGQSYRITLEATDYRSFSRKMSHKLIYAASRQEFAVLPF